MSDTSDNEGWCAACGEWTDVNGYRCDACGENRVNGWMVWLGAA